MRDANSRKVKSTKMAAGYSLVKRQPGIAAAGNFAAPEAMFEQRLPTHAARGGL
jgi:hypothetical protein